MRSAAGKTAQNMRQIENNKGRPTQPTKRRQERAIHEPKWVMSVKLLMLDILFVAGPQ